jgi:hypothetical protein
MKNLILGLMIVLGLFGCSGGPRTQIAASTPTISLPANQAFIEQPTQLPAPKAASTVSDTPTTDPPLKIIKPDNPLLFLKSANLVVQGQGSRQIFAAVSGSLPTPCNPLRTDVTEPDSAGNIFVSVYSVSDSNKVCVQVIRDFQIKVDLKMDGIPAGKYTVWVNGEKIGNFEW